MTGPYGRYCPMCGLDHGPDVTFQKLVAHDCPRKTPPGEPLIPPRYCALCGHASHPGQPHPTPPTTTYTYTDHLSTVRYITQDVTYTSKEPLSEKVRKELARAIADGRKWEDGDIDPDVDVRHGNTVIHF